MLKMMIDALLIAAIGAAVFECGRLSAYYDIADEAKAKYLWLKQQNDYETSPEATETDFEGVKIWKPHQNKKPLTSQPEARQT